MPVKITLKYTDSGQIRLNNKKLGLALPGASMRMLKKLLDNLKFMASGGWSGGAAYRVQPPPRSTYVRTGEYGRKIKVVSTGKRGYRYESRSRHALYVGGNSKGYGQARVHRGRWPVSYQVLKDGMQAFMRDTQRKVKASKTIRAVAQNLGIGL